jgi:DNA-binding XRE family transcriptional regulator
MFRSGAGAGLQSLPAPIPGETTRRVPYICGTLVLMQEPFAAISSAMIIPRQSRMARAALGWTLKDLAEFARVSHVTVNRFEMGHSVSNHSTLAALQRAMEDAGVEFIPENGGGAGVRLRKAARP